MTPDVPVRGVMLDVSRDKVPTMATLRALVDRFASWNLNELQLYMEHTFAYEGHEDVWRDASPFTPDEIRDLDDYCAARDVTLTPNQNCLGHMERWLRHPRYASLGIAREPFTLGGVMRRPPMTMDPANPGALELARDLLRQLVPCFRHSDRVHVGLDEPFELPESRYGDYLDYLVALRDAPELDGKQMIVWGDILATHPELIAKLPDGVTVAEWGYEADHPFDERLTPLADARRDVWVCPGTSSWNSLFGRTTNMRDNQRNAARAATDFGASGWLVTDWGDGGHLQYLPASEPGLGEAAGPFASLGDAYTRAARQTPNMASYLLPLWLPHLRRAFITNDEADAIEAMLVETDLAELDELASREAANSIMLARVLLDDARGRNAGDGTLPGIAAPARTELADRMEPIIDAHRELWLARNRPGGLADSLSWLERMRDGYRTGEVDPNWLPPGLRTVPA